MPKPIEQVSLTRFRGASRTTVISIDPRASLTVIFGENGTGKSAIIDAIDFVANASEGSLKDRSSVKPSDHMPTVGAKARDVSVTVTTQEGAWTATFAGTKPCITGSTPGPIVRVLRRAALAKLIEAQPAQRYEVLRAFIEVPAIEKCEQQLEAALKSTQVQLDNVAVQVRENSSGLTQLWVDDGRPGFDAREWAASKAAADMAQMESLITTTRSLIAVLDKAEVTRDAYRDSLARLRTAEDGVQEARNAIVAAPALDAQDAIALIGVLKSAQEYIAPPKQIWKCPVCEQPVDAVQLCAAIADRLDAVQHLQDLSTAQAKAKQDHFAAQHAHTENALRMLADASALLTAARSSTSIAIVASRINWDDFSVLAASAQDQTLASKAAEFIEGISSLRAALESERDSRQKDIVQHTALKGYWSKIHTGESSVAHIEAVRERLRDAREVMRNRRIAYVQSILDNVAGECSRLYSILHPNESLGNFKFWLDAQRRSSLCQNSEFEGYRDVPPQAYFSESHLDTLGFCLWLSVAKRQDPEETIVILDDIFTSVDSPHLTNIVSLLAEESSSFLQMIVATHSRVWFDRYRLGNGGGRNVQLIVLHRWSLQRGIETSKSTLEIDELRQKLQKVPLDRQGVSSNAGILLEGILDRLALLYKRPLPHQRYSEYALGDLWNACSSLLKKLEIEAEGCTLGPNTTGNQTIPILPYVGPIEVLQFIRNQVGCHFSNVGPEISDTDVEAFGRATLDLSSAVMCRHCGDIPARSRGTHFVCSCGKTKMRPLEFK